MEESTEEGGLARFSLTLSAARENLPFAGHGRSSTCKIAAGIGAAGLATSALNQAIKREDQKAHPAAISSKSIAAVECIFESITNNARATGVSMKNKSNCCNPCRIWAVYWMWGSKKNLRLFSDILQGTGAAAHMQRIDDLQDTSAHLRFLSLEPLLEPVPNLGLTGNHWVIVGGESGHGRGGGQCKKNGCSPFKLNANAQVCLSFLNSGAGSIKRKQGAYLRGARGRKCQEKATPQQSSPAPQRAGKRSG